MFTYKTKNGKGEEIVIKGASSVINIKENTVVFLEKRFEKYYSNLLKAKNCLLFIYESEVPPEVIANNDVRIVTHPYVAYGEFLTEMNAENEEPTEFKQINGAWISVDAKIGDNVSIMPMALIERDVSIGDNTVIRPGAHILSRTSIGKNCVVGDNVIIGQIDFSYDGNQRIPQLGGVTIGDGVILGSNTVVSRGAIDDTIICDYVAVDACCYISHNCYLSKHSKIVGESITFGSVTVGENTFISGNSSIRNGITIGKDCFIGMGSVVINDVRDGAVVMGNPAKER